MSKARDITGQRFGKLTGVELIERINGRAYWKCKCDCGNEAVILLSNLTMGITTSCGCARRKPKDRLGERFGRLTVIEFAGKKRNLYYWKCKCDCGNTVVVSAQNLSSQNTQSCGCLRQEEYEKSRNRLLGKRFGKLTVLQFVENKDYVNYWRCKCDCGNETILPTSSLTTGNTKSCGCLKRSNTLENK